MIDLPTFKQYLVGLNSIGSDDKKIAMNFCKKMDYLYSLKDTVASELNCDDDIFLGYGNVNSKICIICNNPDNLSIIKPIIQETLDKFNINFWDIYVTTFHKTKKPYSKEINFLMNELIAVNPKLIYVIDKDETCMEALKKEYEKFNINYNKMIYVNVVDMASSEAKIKKLLWEKFKFLINYKTIK